MGVFHVQPLPDLLVVNVMLEAVVRCLLIARFLLLLTD